MSFTKGPWSYDPEFSLVVKRHGMACIAKVIGTEADINHQDGYLIAAAPELYEFAKVIKNFCEKGDPFNFPSQMYLTIANAILNKAEGK